MSNIVEISSEAEGDTFISLGDISVLPLQVSGAGANFAVRYVSGSVNVIVLRVRQAFGSGGTPVTFSFTPAQGYQLSVEGDPNNTGNATVTPPNITFTSPAPGTGDTWDVAVRRGGTNFQMEFEVDLTSN